MKRFVKPLVVLAVLGALGYWTYHSAWFAAWTQGPDHSLDLAGSLEARTVEVGSLVGGRIAQVHVEEGDRVVAGQPLVTFEADLKDLEIAQQRAVIAQAEAQLAAITRGPREELKKRLEIDWQAAETDRKRLESLWNAGVIGRREYDATVVREATARQSLREANVGSRREDIAAARAVVERERERLGFLERQRHELIVIAPCAGVVETLDLRPGDLASPNQPIAALLEDGQLWVRVYVPEPRLAEVSVGRVVQVSVDGFPGRFFAGRVVEIRDRGEYTPRNLQTLDQRTDLVFGVKVRIDPNPDLKAGMSVLVELDEPSVSKKVGAR